MGLKRGSAHSGKLHMNFPNSFMVFGSTATPADYSSMEEMGTLFLQGKIPIAVCKADVD